MDLGRVFTAPYYPARAYLLQRGLFALLAGDLWVVMLEHGGRYGAGAFNVAHFAWVDALVPLPTPDLYVGALVLSGLLALGMALAGAPRVGKVLLATVYTGAWIISLHDSYQHHYLLSWLLLWTVFMPDVSAVASAREPVQLSRGWGLPMATITCAVVYTFTGIAKSEAEWRSGAVLRHLSRSKPPGHEQPGVLDPFRDLLVGIGLDTDTAWTCIALSVIALQWTVALGYLASLCRDSAPVRFRSVLTALGWLASLCFHALAELGDMFDIGWFGYYMLWISFVLLAPAAWVAAPTCGLAWLGARVKSWSVGPPWLSSSLAVGVQLALSCALVCLVGLRLDLPGALWASGTFAALVLTLGALSLRGGLRADARSLAISCALTTVGLWLSVAQTSVRFDYYRRAAGELRRMGQLEPSLALYLKAETYAPHGSSRARTIEAIREALEARQKLP